MPSAQQRWNAKHPEVGRRAAKAYRERRPERAKDSQSRSNKKAYAENPEKYKSRTKAYAQANAQKLRAYEKRRRALTIDERKAYDIKYYQANAERLKARSREYGPGWARANPDKVLARSNKHRAAKLRAVPAWADDKKITAIYAESVAITAATGTPHHVDHIVPLQGKTVCGLHVEFNLQILPGTENQSKSARYWPDMP